MIQNTFYPLKPSRYGSKKHCKKIDDDKNLEDCVGRKDRSLLYNAYQIAIGEADDVKGREYKTYWPQEYFINNEKFQTRTIGNKPVKIKATEYQRMLAYLVLTLQNRRRANGDTNQMKCCRQRKSDRDDEFAPEGTRDWNYRSGHKSCDLSFEGRVRHCYTSGKNKYKIKNMEKRMYDLHQIDCRSSKQYRRALDDYEIDGFKECPDDGKCSDKKRCKRDNGMISTKSTTQKSEYRQKLQRRHNGVYNIKPPKGYISVCDYFTQRKAWLIPNETGQV